MKAIGISTRSLVGPYSKYCEISLTSLVTRYQMLTIVSRGLLLVLVLFSCQYGCIRQNTREPRCEVSQCRGAGAAWAGRLQRRQRPGNTTHGAAEQVARSLTSSRESEAQTRDTRVVATALNPLALSLNT